MSPMAKVRGIDRDCAQSRRDHQEKHWHPKLATAKIIRRAQFLAGIRIDVWETRMADPFDPLQERYRRYLLFLGRLHVEPRMRGKLDLEGVVQQTLLDAWQMGPGIDPEGRMAWLRHVLGRNLTDEFRRLSAGKRDINRERSLDAALEASSIRLGSMLAADQSSPSARAMRDEQALQVVEALEQLPEAQREALVLQHWHNWSLAAIGEHLDRTPAAVAGLIKRGLKRLRELLAE